MRAHPRGRGVVQVVFASLVVVFDHPSGLATVTPTLGPAYNSFRELG